MNENEMKRIVEIGGVKVEVDLRTAKRVDSFKVGDPVKVLIKEYANYSSYFGMIVGFDEFQKLPTMIVAYIKASSYEAAMQIVYLNNETKDVEICPHDFCDLGFEKGDVLEQFERQLTKKEEEIRELNRKRSYFLNRFGKYFEQSESAQATT